MSLDNYEVGERLWRDDRYAIYQAFPRDGTHKVWLKMPLSDPPPPHLLESLQRDYEVFRSLGSHCVLKALSLELHGSTTALVLEDFSGLPLSIVLGDSLSMVTRCRIAISICQVLESVHEAGLLHRDLNPANIIVDPQTWEVRLTGFAVEGTLNFMAPEQTGRIRREVDRRSDLYSLGCTLYLMMSGTPPFSGKDDLGVIHSHIAVTPQPPAGTPEVLSRLILKLLAKDPDERYQTAQGVRHDLQLIVNALNQGEELQTFRLGRQDGRNRLSLSPKLYAREGELHALVETWRSVAAGGYRFVLLLGEQGAGKSALVRQARQQIKKEPHLFACAQWRPEEKTLPYSGLIKAFAEAVRKILTESSGDLELHTAGLLSALQNEAVVLAEKIPQLYLLLGPQPAIERLEGEEEEQRFQRVARRFLRALARPGRPFILFLEDLQWADEPSLALLRRLLAERELEHTLVLGCWRREQAGATCPLGEFAEKLELAPLSPEDTATLVGDALRVDPAQAKELARLVHTQSQGNPALVKGLLRTLDERKLIRHEEDQWLWNLDEIREARLTEGLPTKVSDKSGATAMSPRDALDAKLFSYLDQKRWSDVLQVGLPALQALGESLSDESTKAQAWASLVQTELRLHNLSCQSLRQQREMTDPVKKVALRLLRIIGSAAYFARPNLYPVVACRMVNISLTHGNCGESAYGYILYAMAQSAFLGRHQRGYDMGRLALELVERTGALHLQGQVQLLFSVFLAHWKDSLESTLEPLTAAAESSRLHGDAETWHFGVLWLATHRFFSGQSLETIKKELDGAILEAGRELEELVFPLRRLFEGLRGERPTTGVDSLSQEEFLAALEATGNINSLCYHHGYRAIGRYLLGDPAGCLDQMMFCHAHQDWLRGKSSLPVFLFYEALAHLAASRGQSPPRQTLAAVNRAVTALDRWAKSCPSNYLHKLSLVQAELARARGKRYEIVMDLFQQAIRQARSRRYYQDLALAHELAGRYAEDYGFELASRAHLTEAINLYLQWGAKAVARRLVQEFPDLDPHFTRALEPADSIRVEDLDMNTIVSAAQALSQEIFVDRLLTTLTGLLLQNAGAERALLVFNGENGPVVRAEANPGFTQVDHAEPIEVTTRLPRRIVEFVLRTGETVVLDDALQTGDFQNDPYVLRHQVRSVVCAPMLRRGQRSGAVYLENNQACRVFTPGRLRMVEVLAAQAAISLENADHFAKQQRQHEEILKEREARHLEEIRAKELAVRKDTLAGFLGIAAHDLRNALIAIQVWNGQLSANRVGEQVERARALIEDACAHAHGLVRSYLDASQVEVSGHLTLRRGLFALQELVEESLSGALRALPVDRQEEVTIVRELEAIEIEADRERLTQVLTNLISNALLYCPGPVQLNVALSKTTDKVRFDLKDDGPGVTPSQAEDLFEPFRRASTGGDGRGLGLWICKVIVEAHGGKIGVETGSDGGHFWLELPLAAAAAELA